MSGKDWKFKVDKVPSRESVEKKPSNRIPKKQGKLELDFEGVVKKESRALSREYEFYHARAQNRLFAFFIDFFLLLFVSSLAAIFFNEKVLLNSSLFATRSFAFFMVLHFLTFVLPTRVSGQTLGKKMMKIKAEDYDGGHVFMKRVILREYLLKPLSIFLILPMVFILISKSRRSLYDKFLGMHVYSTSEIPDYLNHPQS